jgi:hypothetical protein
MRLAFFKDLLKSSGAALGIIMRSPEGVRDLALALVAPSVDVSAVAGVLAPVPFAAVAAGAAKVTSSEADAAGDIVDEVPGSVFCFSSLQRCSRSRHSSSTACMMLSSTSTCRHHTTTKGLITILLESL